MLSDTVNVIFEAGNILVSFSGCQRFTLSYVCMSNKTVSPNVSVVFFLYLLRSVVAISVETKGGTKF